MLTFFGNWEKSEANIKERRGEWRRMDFYGPFCDISVRKSKDDVFVVPSSVRFVDAENAIGDYQVVVMMCRDLYVEFGKFTLYIPKLNRYLNVKSEDVEPDLQKLIQDIQLL